MEVKPTILVIDDEEDFLDNIRSILERWGYDVDTAVTGYEGLQRISLYHYDLVLLDIIMPLINGLETLKRLKKIDLELPVLVLTGDGRIDTAVLAMKAGAYDYVTKPIDWEKLKVMVKNAMTIRSLTKEVSRLKNQLHTKYGHQNIIGHSAPMLEIYRALDRIIDSDVTVVIQGESGTGKELLARAIHINGNRKDKPFVAVNCAAIPESLLESELFGHEKGSFTGAIAKRIGKFEQAHKGTIFLDEIGEMSKATQSKILRVLQEKRFERVGGIQPVSVDVRVISATNKNLDEEVKNGNFREDLFYRISVYPVTLPPLRERKDDIPELVAYFLGKFNKKLRRKVKSVSNRALEYLINYQWPGNVRELENVLERSILNCSGNILQAEHLPITLVAYDNRGYNDSMRVDFQRAIALARDIPSWEEVEREICRLALKLSNSNISVAASRLGIGRTTLYRKLKKYNLQFR
ncbi:MAG TPA: sigma-54-dependent Fis family transcriptional regulator [Bacteroidetes bacterium]|nr:sigma-54-dependent Fis family transcriptional regulator [Bacteroidota bacterium]